jgi:TonB family protein
MGILRTLLAVGLLFGAISAQAPQLPIPPTELSGAWATIPLPDMPLDVVEHAGALWVCGSNESIARSTDGGRHWELLARREHGQMLFSITFPDAGTIAAFGTEGMRMISRDGGANWTRSYVKPHRSLIQVEFATPTLAFAITDQGYAISHDGGASWKLRDATLVNGIGTRALLVRDAKHAALVRSYSNGKSQELRTTADGGRHFESYKFSQGENWVSLRSTPDGYIAYGYRDERKDLPATAVFHDATGWQLATGPGFAVSDCTAQGCLTADGWAEFGPSTGAVYYQLPDDDAEPLTRAWAVTADTFCKASATLRCRLGRKRYTPAAASAMGKVTQTPKCVHCPNPQYPRQAALVERQGRVFLDLMITKTGEPYDLILLSSPSGSLAEAALATARQWRFRPLEIDGKPCRTEIAMEVSFHFGSF